MSMSKKDRRQAANAFKRTKREREQRKREKTETDKQGNAPDQGATGVR